MTDNPHWRALQEQLERGQLALFIGADLPQEITRLPSRGDLARELARRWGLDEALSLAEVAQRVGQAGKRFGFTDFIRSALDTAGKSPQPFHRRIVELVRVHQIKTIVTTAYDDLLERAFQEAGLGVNCVVRGSDVNFIRPDHPTLVRLYGEARRLETLVVTEQDHSNLLRDRDTEALVDEVRQAFRRNTVLFIGYNLADPDFRFLFDQIAESRFARTAYAVWPRLPEADRQMWRDRNIAILSGDPFGILGASQNRKGRFARTDNGSPNYRPLQDVPPIGYLTPSRGLDTPGVPVVSPPTPPEPDVKAVPSQVSSTELPLPSSSLPHVNVPLHIVLTEQEKALIQRVHPARRSRWPPRRAQGDQDRPRICAAQGT
jgi:hypothetical protein